MAAHCYNLTHCCGCLSQPNSSPRLLATTQLIVTSPATTHQKHLVATIAATTATTTQLVDPLSHRHDLSHAACNASSLQPALSCIAGISSPRLLLATQLVATCHRGCSPPQSPQPNSSPLVAIATSPQLPYPNSSPAATMLLNNLNFRSFPRDS
ncbi:hypothetical protein NL676_012158 [Syzygium grande]|nr:hypothetical protein NL676_012158 [Syzygium grande]